MTRVLICFVLGVALGACAGSKGDTNSPERCFHACEEECPGKGNSDQSFEKYINCVERCETKCGIQAEGE